MRRRTHRNLRKTFAVQCVNEKIDDSVQSLYAMLILYFIFLINLIRTLSENIPQIISNVDETIKSPISFILVILLTRASFALNTIKITFRTRTKETSMRQILFFFCYVFTRISFTSIQFQEQRPLFWFPPSARHSPRICLWFFFFLLLSNDPRTRKRKIAMRRATYAT